jgi:Rieske Fe-S protein
MSRPDDACPCGVPGNRRDFLRDAAALAAGILVGLGVAPAPAGALPLRHATGRRARNGEVSYPIPPADGATIDKKNEVILARSGGIVYAFSLSCPHQNVALRWQAPAGRFQCPKHKSQYQPDGTFITGRATRNMDRLPIRLDGTELKVEVCKVYESDKDPAGWAAAAVKLS